MGKAEGEAIGCVACRPVCVWGVGLGCALPGFRVGGAVEGRGGVGKSGRRRLEEVGRGQCMWGLPCLCGLQVWGVTEDLFFF